MNKCYEGTISAKVIKVVETVETVIEQGTGDAIITTKYWDMDGNFLAEIKRKE